jgi:hypothetical protein
VDKPLSLLKIYNSDSDDNYKDRGAQAAIVKPLIINIDENFYMGIRVERVRKRVKQLKVWDRLGDC